MQWIDEKLVRPLTKLSVPERVSCVMVGLLGGLFPVPALTTVATVALCGLMQLNGATSGVACAINLLVTPLEVILMPIFATLGGKVVGADTSNFTAAYLMEAMKDGVAALFLEAASMLMYATIAWLVVVVAFVVIMKLTT